MLNRKGVADFVLMLIIIIVIAIVILIFYLVLFSPSSISKILPRIPNVFG